MAAAFFVGWLLATLWFVASAFVTPFGGFFGFFSTLGVYAVASGKTILRIYRAHKPVVDGVAMKAAGVALNYIDSRDEAEESTSFEKAS